MNFDEIHFVTKIIPGQSGKFIWTATPA